MLDTILDAISFLRHWQVLAALLVAFSACAWFWSDWFWIGAVIAGVLLAFKIVLSGFTI